MKKVLCFAVVLCMLIGLVVLPVLVSAAQSGTCGENLTWTLDDSGTLTISGTGDMADYTSYSWDQDSSTAPWNSYKQSIKTVIINSDVTSIGKYAFYKCTSLTSVTIQDSVTSIGYGAFYECSSLESIEIPDSVTSIGVNAFKDTKWYENQPDGVVYAGKVAYTYKGEMPENTKIVIKDGTKIIAGRAFYMCRSLESVKIPNSVTSIGEYAFYQCTRLKSIEIPDSVTNVGDCAFKGTEWYDNQPDGVVYVGKVAYVYNGIMPENTKIVIKDGTKSIAENAFEHCKNLISVEIPDSVTGIGGSAFIGYNSLAVYITNMQTWCSIDFYDGRSPFYSGGYDLYLNNKLVTNLEIPDSVTSIGEYAFDHCSSLESITIPDSVTGIGGCAFSYCSSLESITIPDSVTSIGKCAFSNCESLISVEIPNSLTSIESSAFVFCSSLESITIPDSVTSIGDCTFGWCESLESIAIPDSVTSIAPRAFYKCSSLESITIPDNVTSIEYGVFEDCSSLESIAIPDSVTSIASCAFYYCSSLTSIEIPNSVTSIGGYAFLGCDSLTSIEIPNSVASIEISTFAYCSSLESITIPNSMTSIDKNAFAYCESLKKVYFGGSEDEWEEIIIGNGNENLTNAEIYFNGSMLKTPNVSISDLGNDKCAVTVTLPNVEIPKKTYLYVSGFDENGNLISLAIKAAEHENSLNFDVDGVAKIKVMVIGKNLHPLTGIKKIKYN